MAAVFLLVMSEERSAQYQRVCKIKQTATESRSSCGTARWRCCFFRDVSMEMPDRRRGHTQTAHVTRLLRKHHPSLNQPEGMLLASRYGSSGGTIKFVGP